MNGSGLIVSIGSFLVAVVALWMVWRVRQEVTLLKRDRYYLDQKLKSVSPQLEAKIEPLRIQTALLAQGKPISNELIRTGRLYHDISAKEAGEYFLADFPNPHCFWLDVRTDSEYAKQHIPGATLIPVEDLEMRYQSEVPSTVEKIFVYCASGDRSRLACDFLSRHEFGNVYHIKDGLQAWSGPMQGTGAGGLIQIVSKKQKPTNQVRTTVSTSGHPSE